MRYWAFTLLAIACMWLYIGRWLAWGDAVIFLQEVSALVLIQIWWAVKEK